MAMKTKKYGTIICGSFDAVNNWIARLRKIGLNYFVVFRDVRGPALQYGHAKWVEPGSFYVCR